MSGTERLRISRRKYAAPATQESIISIGEETPDKTIVFPIKEVLKNKLRRK